jgi:hypothetical protein
MGQNASDVLWVARDGSPMILVAAQQSMFNETVDRFRGNDNSREALFWPAVFRVNVATVRCRRFRAGLNMCSIGARMLPGGCAWRWHIAMTSG